MPTVILNVLNLTLRIFTEHFWGGKKRLCCYKIDVIIFLSQITEFWQKKRNYTMEKIKKKIGNMKYYYEHLNHLWDLPAF